MKPPERRRFSPTAEQFLPRLEHFAVILFAFRQIIVQKGTHKSPLKTFGVEKEEPIVGQILPLPGNTGNIVTGALR